MLGLHTPTPDATTALPAGAAVEPGAADRLLVERCLQGDTSAWAALVRRYQRLVYAIVTRAGLDEHAAADVFQTVYARLLEHLPRIADPGRLQAWIVTTTKREAIAQRRLGARTVSMTLDDDADDSTWDIADEAPIAEEALADLQQARRLRAALGRLDARSRRVLDLLFRDEPLPYEVVARELNVPVGSIGPTRARCLAKLRRLMAHA